MRCVRRKANSGSTNKVMRHSFLLLLAALVVRCGTGSEATHPVYQDAPRNIHGNSSIAFVSDTQSPLWFERLWLQSDDNELATRRILDEISRDSTCVAL